MAYSRLISDITNVDSMAPMKSNAPSLLSTKVVGHRRGVYLEQIVEGSAYVVAFCDLRERLYKAYESRRYVAVDMSQFYLAEYHKPTSEFVGVKHSDISADISLGFQSLQALEHRSRGAVDFCSKLPRREARVDLYVDAVEHLGQGG